MTEIFADSLTKISDFTGKCVISVNGESLTVKEPHATTPIAKWKHNHIRKFRTEITENLFIFESGRQGPFGVSEYKFELVKDDLFVLQSLLTEFTGAHFTSRVSVCIEDIDGYRRESDSSSTFSPTLKNPTSPVFTNPQASLERMRALALVDNEYMDEETDDGVIKKRQHVYRELVETEQVYLDDLKIVIDAYYDAMDPSNMSIPLRLRGKREVVFGNLLDIYKFHDNVFSKAFEFFADQPERVGECFIQFVAEFDMYTTYCRNRPKSEVLVNDSTENQAFFKGIQRNLAHALDLNSYLLKPIQRITKYQLLLKDLVKCSSKAKSALVDLEIAHGKMLRILQDLNDSMHAAGLKDIPEDLPEQGKLLAHDAFQVATLENQGNSRFPRGKDRHVFLFDKMIILSTKSQTPEDRKGIKKDVYLYKEHLDMSQVTLRETGNPLQFALDLSLQRKRKEYMFEAQSQEIQSMWVSEIRRLLHLQFAHMKMEMERSMSLPRKPQQHQRLLDVGPMRERRVQSDISPIKDQSSNVKEPEPGQIRGRSYAFTDKPTIPRTGSDPEIESREHFSNSQSSPLVLRPNGHRRSKSSSSPPPPPPNDRHQSKSSSSPPPPPPNDRHQSKSSSSPPPPPPNDRHQSKSSSSPPPPPPNDRHQSKSSSSPPPPPPNDWHQSNSSSSPPPTTSPPPPPNDRSSSPQPYPSDEAQPYEIVPFRISYSDVSANNEQSSSGVGQKIRPVLAKKPDFLKDSQDKAKKDKNLQSAQSNGRRREMTPSNDPRRNGGLNVDASVDTAIQDVRSEKSETVWCACGYRSNNHKEALIVYGCGEDSVEGLKKHFKQDNIVFALMKVVEAVDSMTRIKFVYIQWIGERSKPMAKAKTTTIKGALDNIFKPHHASIFATSLSEINSRVIMDTVTNISGSKSHVK